MQERILFRNEKSLDLSKRYRCERASFCFFNLSKEKSLKNPNELLTLKSLRLRAATERSDHKDDEFSFFTPRCSSRTRCLRSTDDENPRARETFPIVKGKARFQRTIIQLVFLLHSRLLPAAEARRAFVIHGFEEVKKGTDERVAGYIMKRCISGLIPFSMNARTGKKPEIESRMPGFSESPGFFLVFFLFSFRILRFSRLDLGGSLFSLPSE